jgi:hypothetical protein
MTRSKQLVQILMAAVAIAGPVAAQNYPPPPPYSQQSPNYPQQQAPYYGQRQSYPQQAPSYAPQHLDELVGRIALFPDPLLAQVLTASTYSYQILDAAGWARAHAYLSADQMVRAIREDRLPWDPSVVGLIPFPSVLNMLAGDMIWTQQLESAVLASRSNVMDAVQRQRSLAMEYGYLRSNQQIRVVPNPGYIEILPAEAGIIYAPYYDPYVVYRRPRPGFAVTGVIGFGPRIAVGGFAPWGWGGVAFGWREHTIIVNNRPWERTWENREAYRHEYSAGRPAVAAPRVERHELREYRGEERRGEERRGDERRRDDRRDERR